MSDAQPVSADKEQRREHRFKDSFKGSLEYLGSSYLCLVDDISQRGFHLLSGAAVDIGDRVSVDLRISEEARLSCLLEVRHVTPDGLGTTIIYIGKEDAYVLSGRLEKLQSVHMVADAVRRGSVLIRR